MTIDSKKKPRTKHPYWVRYSTMLTYCSLGNNLQRRHSDGSRVTVDKIWARENPDGFYNFVEWLDNEFKKKPDAATVHYKVVRIDMNGNFNPGNCALAVGVNKKRSTNKQKPLFSQEKEIDETGEPIGINALESLFGIKPRAVKQINNDESSISQLEAIFK